MENYFSDAEIVAINSAFDDMTGASIIIQKYKDSDGQKRAFFDKAKLWRAIERTISALYLTRLIEGKMYLHDKDGYEYTVIPVVRGDK